MRKLVAETFAAYLLGARAFQSKKGVWDACMWGPFRKERHSDLKWQLDDSNNYWIHFFDEAPGKARLSWRYDGQEEDIDLLIALYNLRFLTRHERVQAEKVTA